MGRINWLDWAKSIAIFFVVFGHVPQVPGAPLLHYVLIFHMPLFFFISGYLHKALPNNRRTLGKYWQSLGIPYILYNLIFYPYWVVRKVFETGADTPFFEFVKPLVGIPLLQVKSPVSTDLNGVTWFIAALLIMKLTLNWCASGKHQTAMMAIISVVCMGLYIVDYETEAVPDAYGLLKCMPFFMMGYYINSRQMISRTDNSRSPTLFLLWGAASVVLFLLIRVQPDVIPIKFGLFYAMCPSSIFMVFYLCKSIDKLRSTVIETVSLGTIMIMGLHWMLIGTTNFVIEKMLHTHDIQYSSAGAAGLSLLFIAATYPLIVLAQKYAPAWLGKRK